jgi:hypothetical protein
LDNFSGGDFVDYLFKTELASDEGEKGKRRTFLSRRLMGFMGESGSKERFVPRGEDGVVIRVSMATSNLVMTISGNLNPRFSSQVFED